MPRHDTATAIAACEELIRGDGSDASLQRTIDLARVALGLDEVSPIVASLKRAKAQEIRARHMRQGETWRAMESALKRAVPWLGKLIADRGHLAAVCPNDAVGALQQAEAALEMAKRVSL